MTRRLRARVALAPVCLALAGCDAVEVTRPVEPPLNGFERLGVAFAVVSVIAIAAAHVLWWLRPPSDMPAASNGSTRAREAGATCFVVAAVAVTLALGVNVAASIRAGDIGCDPAPEVLPETILQLRCSPRDDPASLSVVAAVVGVPVVAAFVVAARLALRGFAEEWLALIAATIAGGALVLGFGGTARGDARVGAFAVALLFLVAAASLGLGGRQGSVGSTSSPSGTTMSQRSRQSAHR